MLKNLINLTSGNRKKVAGMCVALLPRVGYARVTRSGIVILKKSWWSLSRKRIPITDLILKYLPLQIGALVRKKAERDVYVSLFNYKVATLVSLTRYTPHLDLFAYVYKEYAKACLMVEPEEEVVVDYQEPIAPRIQSFNIQKVLKDSKPVYNKYKISDKIKKLKSSISLNPIATIINLRLTTN